MHSRHQHCPCIEAALARVRDELSRTVATSTDLPRSLVHADINERNVLVDDAGSVVALLDFDDCLDSHLVYDLCSLIGTWGLDEARMLDGPPTRALVAAYERRRSLTNAERETLPLFLLAYLGAHGSEYVENPRRRELFEPGVSESFSARTFIAFEADRLLWPFGSQRAE